MSSSTSAPCHTTSPDDFQIRIATEDDKPQMEDFVGTFFLRDEPLCKCIGLVVDGEPINSEVMKSCVDDIDDGVSLLALHGGKLVGVCISSVLKKDEQEGKEKKHGKFTDEKLKKIIDLLDHQVEEARLFDRFPEADRGMSVDVVSVDASYRGKGIAKLLMDRTRELAIEKGCGFITVSCTSHFTAMASKKLGFELRHSLNYSDYKPHGEVVFHPEPPHTAATVYVQRL